MGGIMDRNSNDNYSRIFNLIYQREKISKQEIALELNLSLPTVSSNLTELKKNKLIRIGGKFESQVGRRAKAYSVSANTHISLGIEIFKEHVTISALDLNGKETATATEKLSYSNDDAYFKKLATWINSFTGKNKLADKHILGIGMGVQGLVSHDGQTVLWGKILESTGLTTESLGKYLPYPVSFYHDADCVAAAEQFLTNSHQDTTYLSIGEHLGTAIVSNNRIYSGENGRSGTMEHITLNMQSDRKCYCGRHGCIETYCSMSSLLNEDESIEDFMASLKAGDEETQERWHVYLNFLAEAINNLHMFLDNRLVIAGELIRYLDSSVIKNLDQRIRNITAFPEDHSYLSLGMVTARPVAIGAAIPRIESFVESI
ncbi:sugar kinase [Levilactobacillus brevis]|uniref:Sugar kinase n=2 Tax=Levilactobacillus brevis TaxID=1580 RepID=A0A2A3TUM2_LEVBR|nr:sugar kinase [Levilactobacillus brevis]